MHYNRIRIVIIVKIFFICSFPLIVVVLYNHSFKTNPNTVTNLSKLYKLHFVLNAFRLFLIFESGMSKDVSNKRDSKLDTKLDSKLTMGMMSSLASATQPSSSSPRETNSSRLRRQSAKHIVAQEEYVKIEM